MTTAGTTVPFVSRRVVLAVVGFVLLAGVPLAAPPAVAQPAAVSTMSVVASYDADVRRVFASAEVVAAGDDRPTGVVVLSEGGQEVARGTLKPGAAGKASVSVYLELDPGQHLIEGTYLGDSAVAGSSASVTVGVLPVSPPTYPITAGKVRVGDIEAPMGTAGRFADGPSYLVYDSRTGGITPAMSMDLVEFTKQVPGVGRVTVVVQPDVYLVDPWVTSDGLVQARDSSVLLRVRWLEVDGMASVTTCSARAPRMPATGSLVPGGLVLSMEAAGAVTLPRPDECGGMGALVGTVLSGPVSLTFEVAGDFAPLPPAPNTPTTTVLEISDTDLEEFGAATATIRVETASGQQVRGTVVLKVDGRRSSTSGIQDEGVVTLPFPLGQAGPHQISAEYSGEGHRFLDSVDLFAPSSDTVDIDVREADAGWPVTGEFATLDRSAALPAGARLANPDLDVEAGRLQGSLIIPPGSIDALLWTQMKGQWISFPATVDYQIIPEADLVVTAVGDQIVVEPLPVRLVVWAFDSVVDSTRPCTFGPFDLDLTASVDATGLHLASGPVLLPDSIDGGCAGAQALLTPQVHLKLDIADPNPAQSISTTTQVVSWFPSVAQFDNTYLVAAVKGAGAGPTPVGSVEFSDGDRMLGTVPVGGDGRAVLMATMTAAGTRSVTAEFVPGDGFNPSTAMTQVTVTGLVGRALSGVVTIGDTALEVGSGSALRPSTDPLGTGAMFAPDVVDLVVDGEPVQAEVRLIQIFDPTVETASDGTVTAFDGRFLLHVRSVTTPTGTVYPTWCVNGVVFRSGDGVPTVTASRAPLPQCTGIGDAVVSNLVGEGVADLVAGPG